MPRRPRPQHCRRGRDPRDRQDDHVTGRPHARARAKHGGTSDEGDRCRLQSSRRYSPATAPAPQQVRSAHQTTDASHPPPSRTGPVLVPEARRARPAGWLGRLGRKNRWAGLPRLPRTDARPKRGCTVSRKLYQLLRPRSPVNRSAVGWSVGRLGLDGWCSESSLHCRALVGRPFEAF